MPLAPNDLHQPLGLPAAKTPRKTPRRFFREARPLAILALVGAGLGLLNYLSGKPEHGGPFAVATIAPPAPKPALPKEGPERPAPQRATQTAAELEDASGVTVVRPGGGEVPTSLVIHVPDTPRPLRLAAAPDPRLVERGEFGPLPRIGADGARPAQVYARPAPAPAAGGRPRIALVIGGLGLNDASTASAVGRLPGEISLAFAPYGANLKAQVTKAREAGHEVLLQVPMEPFDYPQTNPGPQTLTTDAGAAQNLERLRWVMARAPGFVGLENFLGARFTADEAAVTPVLKELAGRGLIFVDDGSSARSITPAIAAGLDLPLRRADMVIDADASQAAIDAALARLETLARDKGVASGSGSALPVTIERLARWAQALRERGIDLVPVTATLALKGKG